MSRDKFLLYIFIVEQSLQILNIVDLKYFKVLFYYSKQKHHIQFVQKCLLELYVISLQNVEDD